MEIISTISELRKFRQAFDIAGKNVAFVPTMGGLHQGHFALIERAKKIAEVVIVSIFTNPTQFSENEDFATYPANLDNDLAALSPCEIDCVFTPEIDEIYPDGFASNYDIGRLGEILCAKTRPHFFIGVVQVLTKLFTIISPEKVVFGQKDYQQLLIVKDLVLRLNLPIEIIEVAIVRANNGLAFSTRNQYLSTIERQIAPNFYKVLQDLVQEYHHNQDLKMLIINGTKRLKKHFIIDYLEVLDANTLEKINDNSEQIVLLSAVFIGQIRLLDNIKFRRKYV